MQTMPDQTPDLSFQVRRTAQGDAERGRVLRSALDDDGKTSLGSGKTHQGFCETIQGSGNILQGFHETIQGSGNILQGFHETILGFENTFQGFHKTIQGSGNTLQGFRKTIQGSENTLQGSGNTFQGFRETIQGSGKTIQGFWNSRRGFGWTCQGFVDLALDVAAGKLGARHTLVAGAFSCRPFEAQAFGFWDGLRWPLFGCLFFGRTPPL